MCRRGQGKRALGQSKMPQNAKEGLSVYMMMLLLPSPCALLPVSPYRYLAAQQSTPPLASPSAPAWQAKSWRCPQVRGTQGVI